MPTSVECSIGKCEPMYSKSDLASAGTFGFYLCLWYGLHFGTQCDLKGGCKFIARLRPYVSICCIYKASKTKQNHTATVWYASGWKKSEKVLSLGWNYIVGSTNCCGCNSLCICIRMYLCASINIYISWIKKKKSFDNLVMDTFEYCCSFYLALINSCRRYDRYVLSRLKNKKKNAFEVTSHQRNKLQMVTMLFSFTTLKFNDGTAFIVKREQFNR